MRTLFILFYHILSFWHGRITCFNFNIIFLTIGDNPLLGYYASAPFFDVAYELVSKKYPSVFQNSTRQIFYKPGLIACPDAGAYMFIATGEIYDIISKLKGFTIIICPGDHSFILCTKRQLSNKKFDCTTLIFLIHNFKGKAGFELKRSKFPSEKVLEVSDTFSASQGDL